MAQGSSRQHMFSKFFNPEDKESAATKAAVDTPGVEVKEDDPETAWSEWDSVLAELDHRMGGSNDLPTQPAPIRPDIDIAPDYETPTQPMSLDDTREREKNHALAIVETYHPRIARSIRTLWGYKECSAYIDKLIINGDDGTGKSRVGFNQEAVDAMLTLTHLHDERFGDFGGGKETGYGDFRVPTAWDHLS
jgi:hypothetical protein